MSNNYVKINYADIKLPPSEIEATKLERLQKLDANIQSKIKQYRDYIYEADNLIKHVSFINKEWLELSILAFEEKIRNLEGLYK